MFQFVQIDTFLIAAESFLGLFQLVSLGSDIDGSTLLDV